MDFTYDALGQLSNAVGRETLTGALRYHEQWSYGYDTAGKLDPSGATTSSRRRSPLANTGNEIGSVSKFGTLTLAGAVSPGATSVTVGGQSVTPYADGDQRPVLETAWLAMWLADKLVNGCLRLRV